jgi:hypothetical protein
MVCGFQDFQRPDAAVIIYSVDMGNTFKTALPLTALTLFLLFMGQIFGGQRGMEIAPRAGCRHELRFVFL